MRINTITGQPITNDDEFGYIKKVDVVDASNTYVGYSKSGIASDAATWQIYKITVSGTVTTTQYADADPEFNKVWDDRASYNYAG